MSIRKLLRGLDSLDLNIQQLGFNPRSIMLNMKRKVGHPLVSNEEGQNHKTSEVNFELPPRFDECGE